MVDATTVANIAVKTTSTTSSITIVMLICSFPCFMTWGPDHRAELEEDMHRARQ